MRVTKRGRIPGCGTAAATWLLVLTIGCGLSGEGDPAAGEAATIPGAGLQRPAPEPTPALEPAALAATAEAVASALKPSDAAGHVGEEQAVCGAVTGTRQEDSFKPLFLDFGPPFPDQVFMVHFITFTGRVGDWPDQIDRSIDIKEWFDGRSICVRGRIEWYRDTPAMNANYWHQYHVVR